MATILIDGNAIGNHYHHATTLTVGKFETQAVFGFVKLLRDLAHAYPLHEIIVLWDGRADFRFDLLPTYKGKREEATATDPDKAKKKAAYHEQRPLIEKVCDMLGVRQMKANNLEADDLAGFMVSRLSRIQGHSVLMVTGDSDWWQLVGERITWLDPRGSGRRVSMGNFLEETGYHTPVEYLQGKALTGDSTDDIPPVGGIGKKSAPVFMAKFGSVEEFWRRCDAGETPKGVALTSLWKGEGRQNFERNMKLIKLIDAPPPEAGQLVIRKGNYSEDGFKALCERLLFMSILKDFDNFVQPFRKRWAARISKEAA